MQKYYNKHRFFHIVVFHFLIPVNIYDQDDLPFDWNRHGITEILLKVALKHHKPTLWLKV